MQIILAAREGKGPDFRPHAILLEANFVCIERSNCSSPPLSYISWGPTFKVVRPLATTHNPTCKQLNQKQVAGSLFSGQSRNEMLKKFALILLFFLLQPYLPYDKNLRKHYTEKEHFSRKYCAYWKEKRHRNVLRVMFFRYFYITSIIYLSVRK